MKIVIIAFFFISVFNLSAQKGLHLNEEEALESYTLFDNENGAYLIDNCGSIINKWENLGDIDNHLKFLDNGHLLFIQNNNSILEVDWDGNVTKFTNKRDFNLKLDYEVIKLPNGNYLCTGRRIESQGFFIFKGYNPSNGFPKYDDTVVEIEAESGLVVWEWRISDHVIQQRDSLRSNYGILSENPGKLNVDAISEIDWRFDETFMINGIDYNAELDQIALSIRKISEVIIIDHSTTTDEAKTGEGGTHGMGGDILYRWGNPQNYNQGSSANRVLYYQHNPNWIQHGANKNKLMIYNNGLDRPVPSFEDSYSEAIILDTKVNADGSYTKVNNAAFSPPLADDIFSGQDFNFYSGYTSAAKVLPNGNTFITVGGNGRLIEITADKNLVWDYTIPDRRFNFFRAVKYPRDHPAFENKDLTPGHLLIPGELICDGTSVTDHRKLHFELRITQVSNNLELECKSDIFGFQIINNTGQVLETINKFSNYHQIDILNFARGLYFVRSFTNSSTQTETIFIK